MTDSSSTAAVIPVSHAKSVFGGEMVEGVIGIGTIVLAIIGLTSAFPEFMVSIAIIAVGLALSFEGGIMYARYAALNNEGRTRTDVYMHWGGVTFLYLAGMVGIALGILSLIGIVPMVLIPVAAIVFGSSLLLDGVVNERLSVLEAHHSEEFKTSERVIRRTDQVSGWVQMLIGVGSLALGILALNGIYTMAFCLIVMLGLGAVDLLTGAMIGGRMSRFFR